MKRIFVAISALMVAVGIAMAASETVYLKNGSVIKGNIIEQVPGQSLKIRTADGSMFVYSVDEIERITKEDNYSPNENGHRGLDFGIDAGVDIMNGGTNIPVELMLSKRFNRNISLGLGAGVNIPTGGGDATIPIFLDFKGYLPLKSTKLTPFVDIRGGYAINTASDVTVGSGKYKVTVKASDFVTASIMPGIRIPMSNRTDLDFGLGYMMYAPTGGGGKVTSAFAMRLGLNFHKSSNPINRPPVPTRNTGFEFGFDAYGAQDLGLNLLFGYRLSKKLSVGLGVGVSNSITDVKSTRVATYYSEPDAQGAVAHEDKDEESDNLTFLKVFLRGEYRFTTKPFSPYVALDLGLRKTMADDEYSVSGFPDNFKAYCSGFFARPAVGISWRCTNNSYIQLHIDYELSNGGVKSYNVTENRNGYRGGRYQSIHYKCDGGKFSAFSVGITWKRTFGLFSRD